jgi:hypothetical protein
MELFVHDVTDEDIDDYEVERLASLRQMSANAPEGVAYNWVPPKLNPDGSLTAAERQKTLASNASKAWSGTKQSL